MKTLTDWKLHSWYRTSDGRKAWLAAITIGPDGEPLSDWPLLFCAGNNESWYANVEGQYRTGQPRDCDIIGPWTDEPRPIGRYCPVNNPPTDEDGEHVLVCVDEDSAPYITKAIYILGHQTAYKWWCPLKPILEMEVSE